MFSIMKNILVYYLAILVPFISLFILLFTHSINSLAFTILILSWALIYRPVVDATRLIQKGMIPKSDFWKLFIPFYRRRWFKELYS